MSRRFVIVESKALSKRNHSDPHAILGLHELEIRLWRPGASELFLEVLGQIVSAEKRTQDGLFVYVLKDPISPYDYRVYHQDGKLAHDPYVFESTLSHPDLELFKRGEYFELYHLLGAHLMVQHGISGVRFSVWAPHAQGVGLRADFNGWDGGSFPMRKVGDVWELFVPGLKEGDAYQFEIRTQAGELLIKSDPVAFYAQLRPQQASVIASTNQYPWSDQSWMEKRKRSLNQPINIYEVHLGSWKRFTKPFPQYRELASALGQYCLDMGFTHVELLPVMEHPLDESWGYQVTGFFAVTSRYGSVQDFQFFVDTLHQMGIGVILDWVPAHFPTDLFALTLFDGTPLYEDAKMGSHPHWDTAHFDYAQKEVSNFLIASALFWCDRMHIDGIRVDAVSSMLYLDFGRKEGEWIPNEEGTNVNLHAVAFLKKLNHTVHEKFPGVLMCAEEATAYLDVTHFEGLNFDLKWNMGWMNDTLRYIQREFDEREKHQDELTFNILYVFSEKFISVLSHDEIVHEKKSLLLKMPGSPLEKYAGVRLLYTYMVGHPGKQLLFMGNEFAQEREWASSQSLDWSLLEEPMHRGVQKLVADCNALYLRSPSLWENDFHHDGYEWVQFRDAHQSTISYLRKAQGHPPLLFFHNFSNRELKNYQIPLKGVQRAVEVLNTNAKQYGGSGSLNETISIDPNGISFQASPLSTLIFEVNL